MVYSDEESSNGIFYEIDTVLIPPSYQKTDEMDNTNVTFGIFLFKYSLWSGDRYVIYFTNINSFIKQRKNGIAK